MPKKTVTSKTAGSKSTHKPLPKRIPKEKAPIARSKAGKRVFEQPKYKAFKYSKRIKHPKPPLPKARVIFGRSVKLLFKNWRLMGGIFMVYFVISVLLVRGFGSQLGLPDMKGYLDSIFGGGIGHLVTGFSVFNLLLNNLGSASSEVSGAYEAIMLVVMSLVVIWALRQIMAGTRATVRDAFYKSMYPLIPFLLVLVVVGIQLIPIAADSYFYNLAIKQAVAVTFTEKALMFTVFGLMGLWSLYMISSSMIALYIVALPDVRPVAALKAANKLVNFRRWTVMRKVVYLPITLLLIWVIIMFPFILFLPVVAEWVFFVLTLVTIMFIHTYMYSLYRELIK